MRRKPVVLVIPYDVQSLPAVDMVGCSVRPSKSTGQLRSADPSAPPASTRTTEAKVSYREVLTAAAVTWSGAPVFVDSGQARHAAHITQFEDGWNFYDCPRSAPMGWAIGASVGAAVALGSDAAVLCITGDGSAAMLGSEMATAARYRANVTFLVCENGVLGSPFGRHRWGAAADAGRLAVFDWLAFAEAVGVVGQRVDSVAGLTAALATRRQALGPALIIVPTPEVDADISAPYRLA